MVSCHLPSAEHLRSIISYDQSTGIFRWLDKASSSRLNVRFVGSIAGTEHGNGYLKICILGRRYYCHRLAWLYMTGKWPSKHIDHINRDKSDNRFSNLREASKSENGINRSRPRNNKSGATGVAWYAPRQKWHVRIGHTHLGYFEDFETAKAARSAAEKQHFGEFAANPVQAPN